MVVVRHGLHETQDRHRCVQALLEQRAQQESEASEAQQLAGGINRDADLAADREQLRRAALRARLEYKRAQKLNRLVTKDGANWLRMGSDDHTLLRELYAGRLYQRRVAASQQYGHEIGADVLSLANCAVLSARSDDFLRSYMST